MAGGLVQMGRAPAPTSTTTPGSMTAGPGFNPAPLTPTPAGMAAWAKVQKSLAKRAAKTKRAGSIGARGPKTVASDPSGTGGPNDPAWKNLASLYQNGLPG